MEPRRWRQVKKILGQALELTEDQRAAALERACGGDEELRREVESLIAAAQGTDRIVDEPLFRLRDSSSEPSMEGRRIGRYRVVRELGRGGLGTVYLAVRADEEFEKYVALKIIRRGMDTDDVVRRFRTERQILARLDHPHIAKLLDGGTTDDGQPYFVMEYVEGRRIDEYCDEQELSIEERLELFRCVCMAVHFAHQNLVVHRDLKPGNILETSEGPKLLDFGIAKWLAPDGNAAATHATVGTRFMTPDYSSPEQARGEAVTTATDVYSLGVLLYELLTGHRPHCFEARRPEQIAEDEPSKPSTAVLQELEVSRGDGTTSRLSPEDVSRRRREQPRALSRRLTGDLDNIVMMAIEKDPRRRYASAEQLAEDVRRFLRGFPVIARKDTLGYRTAKFVRRHRVGVSVSAGVMVLVVVSGLIMALLWNQAENERWQALRAQHRAEQVSTFLEELFRFSDPTRTRGEEVAVFEILEQGREKIRESLEGEPEVRAALMETMGRVYRNLGLYEESRQLLESALELHRSSLGEDHLAVAQGLHQLGVLFHEMGDSDAAEPLLRQALDIQRRHHPDQAPQLSRGLTNLAAVLEAKGLFKDAEELYREALEIKQKHLGEDDPEVARAFNNLGVSLFHQGRLEEAEPLLRRALALRRRWIGEVSPEVATTLNNLATLLEASGRREEAEALHRETLALRRKIYGSDHPKVAVSLNNLAFFLHVGGRPGAAESLYREALEIQGRRLSSRHPHRAVVMRNLASLLVSTGRAKEAEALALQAVEIFAASYPRGHWRIADAQSILGSCWSHLGRPAEAEPLLVESLRVLEEKRGAASRPAREALERLTDLRRSRDSSRREP